MSIVSLIVIALVFTLFVLCVLAMVMLGASYDRETEEMGVALGESSHGALLEGVESEKHRLIADAMKADRDAALQRIGGGA